LDLFLQGEPFILFGLPAAGLFFPLRQPAGGLPDSR